MKLATLKPSALLVSAMLVLSACSAGALNLVTSRSGYERIADLPYGEGERRRFDLYVPDGATATTPVVVFFHGGSWDSGDKGIYRFLGQAVTAEGFIVAVPNYRLYPETTFPGFVEDGAAAMRAVEALMREGTSGLPAGERPLLLIGHSAGAQIAALLAFDERYLAAAGTTRERIAGFVGLSGPYDFLPLDEERYKRIFPEPTRPQSQPINFADAGGPPTLLLHGLADTTVEPRNTRAMGKAINEAGGQAETRFFEGVDHITPIASFATALPIGEAAIPKAVFDFLQAHAQ